MTGAASIARRARSALAAAPAALRRARPRGPARPAGAGRVDVAPLWARAYRAYARRAPEHRGKRRVLAALHRAGLRGRRPFACRMANGAWLAIRPEEGTLIDDSVGWTCFLRGRWDPRVEACLRALLRPGEAAIDVGAHAGYFTAVMAQCVGPAGRVWSFEPVRETFELLELCVALNGLHGVSARNCGLGAADGWAEITFPPAHSGLATLHPEQVAGDVERIELRALDGLVAVGEVEPSPALIKIDVEGHELEVLRGARETIARARPAIVFEYNERTARAAGWTLADVAELLCSLAEYEFLDVTEDGLRPLDARTFRLEPDAASDAHIDVLARPLPARA